MRRGSLRWLALCGIFGPIVLLVLVVAASLLRPGYDQASQLLSELGVGANGILLDLAVILSNLLFIALFIGLYLDIGDGHASKVPPAVAIAGSAVGLLPGFFTCSVADCSAFDVHIASFVISLVLLIAAVFLFARSFGRDGRWKALSRWSVLAGLLDVGIFLMLLLGGQGALAPWRGALERVIAVISFAWIEAVAIHLFRLTGESPAAASVSEDRA